MLPKKVRRELSVNESLNRWFYYKLKRLLKCQDVHAVVQRRGDNLYTLPILEIRRDCHGTYIEVGE